MSLTPSYTVDNVLDALAVFLQPFDPSATIINSNANRVPFPNAPVIVLQDLLSVALETPTTHYTDTTATFTEPSRLDVQLDIYSEYAGDTAKAIRGTFRTIWAADQFPAGIAPLYCSDATRAPIVTGENQYEDRWILTVSLQYNADVTAPQDTFNTRGQVGVIPADVIY